MTDKIVSWVDVPEDSDFSMYNFPFGVFRTQHLTPRCCTALGDYVIDLTVLAEHGYFGKLAISGTTFHKKSLNDFIGLGKEITNAVRNRLITLFTKGKAELENDKDLHPFLFYKHDQAKMMMPVAVGDYTDFYSSKEHATRVGAMFRDPSNALLPNWKHLPVAYHGRASSIVVSDTPVHRPNGQFKKKDALIPSFGPTEALDFELEVAFIIGKNTKHGESVSVEQADDHIFGFVLFNDWSARDVQSWEYVPLGPFLAKNFLSSVSPWVVTLEAMELFRTQGPTQDVEVLPYLSFTGIKNYDLQLDVSLQPEGSEAHRISHSNTKYLYWNTAQQLAHHTVNGCNISVGDMMASGTVSGPERKHSGCLLELTNQGKEPIMLSESVNRKYLEDGDTVTFKAFAVRDHVRVGFGEVKGKIHPAL